MKKIKRIILLIVLVFIYAELLSAHQGHYNKNENLSKTELSSKTTKTQVIEDVNNYNNCNSNDLMGLECCCCINGICFQFDNGRNCQTDDMPNQISCKSKCENAKSKDDIFISQNDKIQNFYRIYFLNNFLLNKESCNNNTNTSQKKISNNTPTYISIQSLLI